MSIVSVVIPIGNEINYLKQTINTIQNQILKDIEIICIDDASTDGSGELLDEFSEIDKRIIVFHMKEKIGAARARNIGMDLAKSSYVIFLDADDLFESDMLSEMYSQIEKYQADVCMVEYDTFDTTQERKKNQIVDFYISQSIFRVTELAEDILTRLLLAPWNKMIKKSFLINNNIRFQDIEAANDVYFSTLVYLLASKIIYIDSQIPKIHYRTNLNTQISSRRTPFHVYEAFKAIKEELIKRDIWELSWQKVSVSFLVSMLGEIYNCKELNIKRTAYELLKNDGIKYFELEKLCSQQEVIYAIQNSSYENVEGIFYIIRKSKLQQKKDKIVALCRFMNESKQKWAFWGAGVKNVMIIDFIEELDMRVSYEVIDNDNRKHGMLVGNSYVCGAEAGLQNVNVVIVSNKMYLSAIYHQVKNFNNNIKVFLYYQYFDEDVSLDKCFI